MNAVWILTRLTVREATRRRILLAGLVLGLGFLLIYSTGLHFIITSMREEAAAALPSESVANILQAEAMNFFLMAGYYAVTFLSISMAALLGADTLAGEINSGTIQTIATKPIRRAHVVLGKWLGFAILLGGYVTLMAGGATLSMFLQSGYAPRHLFLGLGLIYMEAVLIMTLTLMFSSIFPALATGGIVFGLYGLSFIGGWVEQIGSMLQNQTAVNVGIIASLIIPSESLWRRATFEMQSPLISSVFGSPFVSTSVPSPLMVFYALVYLIACLVVAVRLFEKRDL